MGSRSSFADGIVLSNRLRGPGESHLGWLAMGQSSLVVVGSPRSSVMWLAYFAALELAAGLVEPSAATGRVWAESGERRRLPATEGRRAHKRLDVVAPGEQV